MRQQWLMVTLGRLLNVNAHRTNPDFLDNCRLLVYVYTIKSYRVVMLLGELLEHRPNGFARCTPRRPKVDYSWFWPIDLYKSYGASVRSPNISESIGESTNGSSEVVVGVNKLNGHSKYGSERGEKLIYT
jgi:hypothetical protein